MDEKEQIKERLDIEEVISEYLELRPAGYAGKKALCPFHGEKTPSFHVSKEKQIWHCFGCQKGGDIFSFVMEMEGIDFYEALKLLAKKANIELKPRKGAVKKESFDNLYDLLDSACSFFEAILEKHEKAQVARNYVNERGIPSDVRAEFRIGYAPNDWSVLRDYFAKKGVSDDLLRKAGLIKPRTSGSGFIDQFRHRLMIPLSDSQGRVVGFTGRLIEPNDKAPKYVNTPETPIFSKRNILYGLHLAKTAIRSERHVILVEGNLDVVASHKAGIKQVAASSGTAITEDHLRLLKRYTKNIHFALDTDAAGFEALRKSAQLALKFGFTVKVIPYGKYGKDPDEIVQNNAELWKEAVANPSSYLEYIYDHLTNKLSISSVEGKREFFQVFSEELRAVSDLVVFEHWLQVLSDTLRMPADEIRKSIGAPRGAQTERVKSESKPLPHASKAQLLAGLMMLLNDFSRASELEGRINGEVYRILEEAYTDSREIDEAQLSQNSEAHTWLRTAYLQAQDEYGEFSPEQWRKEIDQLLTFFASKDEKVLRKQLESDIRLAEERGDKEALERLLAEYQQRISRS
jgi:DNA primase